jgi:hypothetical protein
MTTARRATKSDPTIRRLTLGATASHERQRCTSTARSGHRCKSAPVIGTQKCPLHTPGVASKLGTRGGRRRAIFDPAGLEKFGAPKDASDIVEILAATIVEIRESRMESKTAATVGQLSGAFLNALEVADLDIRLKRVEEALRERQS